MREITRRSFIKGAGTVLAVPTIIIPRHASSINRRSGFHSQENRLETIVPGKNPKDPGAQQGDRNDYGKLRNILLNGLVYTQLTGLDTPYSQEMFADASHDINNQEIIYESTRGETNRPEVDWYCDIMSIDDKMIRPFEPEMTASEKARANIWDWVRPKYDPTGRLIATVARLRDGNWRHLYVTERDGKNPKKMAEAELRIEGLAWDPGGELIFYHSVDSNFSHTIRRLDLKTGEDVLEIRETALHPAVSYNKGNLAYAKLDGDYLRIFVKDLETGLTKVLTNYNIDTFPAWSLDGKWIAFARGGWPWTPPQDIYVIPSDGGDAIQLTESVRQGKIHTHWAPVWSPDGKRIYWTAGVVETDLPSHIWQMENLPTGIENKVAMNPEGYSLSPNYPNPFNSGTNIEYTLGHRSDVQLSICNIKGELVGTLVNEVQEPGLHKVRWPGTDMNGFLTPTGTYLYKLQAGDFNKTGIMQKVR